MVASSRGKGSLMTREEQIERFIAENKNNRKKYRKVGGYDKYMANKEAVENGTASWVFNGKRWVLIRLKTS